MLIFVLNNKKKLNMAELNISTRLQSKFLSFIESDTDSKSRIFESLYSTPDGFNPQQLIEYIEYFHSLVKNVEQREINYEFKGHILGKVPTALKSIVECIKKSENILALEDNWDTEGSKGFSEKTWKSSAIFLLNYSRQLNSILGYIVDTPKIYPGPNGSIDIDWETSNYGLIINIADGGELATYYGDNKAQQMTEGVFNPLNFNIHLLPLAIQL